MDSSIQENTGFRMGAKGTHTSRTMMFEELSVLLSEVEAQALRADYSQKVIEENILSKQTRATRKLTNQRLGELYGLDPKVPPFRVLRMLWRIDPLVQSQLALLLSMARDPLLLGTADYIATMKNGEELSRTKLKAAISEVVMGRLNDSILDKVARNIASTWTQSGHLEGRTFKIRKVIKPSFVSVAYSLYLANLAGLQNEELLNSGWIKILDCDSAKAREFAFEASRAGIIDVSAPSEYLEFSFDKIDPWKRK